MSITYISKKLLPAIGAPRLLDFLKRRETITAEPHFLPRAFVKPYRMLAYVDLKNGWLVVDTSSRTAFQSPKRTACLPPRSWNSQYRWSCFACWPD